MSTTTEFSKKQEAVSSHLDIISEQRNLKQFCDLTLIVGEEKFPVHKVILTSNIPYFKEMFSNDKYQEYHKSEIILADLDPAIMSVILDYIYTRKVEITTENIVKILDHADYLMMQDLRVLCEEQMTEEISATTCIVSYELSNVYHFENLKHKANKVFRRNLADVSETLPFLELPLEKVCDLSSALKDKNAEHAFLAFINWIKFDVDERKSFLSELLRMIPQKNISFNFFRNHIEKEMLLREIHECSLWALELAILLAKNAASV